MEISKYKLNKWVLLVLLMIPAFASADEVQARGELIATLHHMVVYFGQFMGVLLFISAGMKLKAASDAGASGRSNKATIYVTFIAATLMLNYSNSLTTYIATLLGNDYSHCFILDKSQSIGDSCWDSSSSELTGELKERITKLSNGSVAEKFMDNLNVIVGIFQMIGLIYFFVGVYGLVQVSNGGRDGGYGKPIITMIASALIVDLPHTAEMFIDTLNAVGINF